MTHPLLLQSSSPKLARTRVATTLLVGLAASACHVSTRTEEEVQAIQADMCGAADQEYEFGVLQSYEALPALADPVVIDADAAPVVFDPTPVVVDAGDFPASAYPNGGVCVPVPEVPANQPPNGAGWWSYGDPVPGASHTVYVDRIRVGQGATDDPDAGSLLPLIDGGTPGARCASKKALVFESKRHRDWGAGFGANIGIYGAQPQYGRAQEGDYDLDSGRPLGNSETFRTNRLNCAVAYNPGNVNADLGAANADPNLPPLLTGPAQGISFWAKADANSTVSMVIRLQDQRGYADVQPFVSMSPESECGATLTAQCKQGDKAAYTPDGAAPAVCDPRGYELLPEDAPWPAPGTTLEAGAPLDPNVNYGNFCSLCEDAGNENRCGNFFDYPLTVTHEWALYRIPFSQFRQGVNGRRFSQVDRQHLRMMEIKFPKDSEVKIWIDDLGFYRRR
jgi:hypothetical protein